MVDSSGDVVTENPGEGNDVVQSSVTYTLSANVETLMLANSSAINGTGNALDNTIIGNGVNNTLAGLGAPIISMAVPGSTPRPMRRRHRP